MNLPAGGSVTFLVSATIDAAARGILVNTATISPPADVADHDPSNDTATDITTLTPVADLSITKDDGQTAAVAGSSAVYTIVASNAGPSSAIGATIADPLPTGALGSTWSCTATTGSACGAPSGAGALATTADIAPSGSVTYTVSVQIDPSAQGSFTNTATVEMATGGTDTDASNNSATDTDQLRAEGTLTLTKTHTTTPVVAGAAIQYVLVAGNAGPSTARGVRVLDPLPPDLLGATWTCTAPAGSACAPATGTGDVDVVVDLLPGANATITVDATLDQAAAGTLSNAATLVVPSDFTSLGPLPAPVDVAEIDHVSDLVVTKDDHTDSVTSGATTTYEIVVRNLGPSDAVAANVSDPVPAGLTGFTWTCTGSNGAVCRDPSGTGSLNAPVDVPVGGTLTFSLTATVTAQSGTVENVVSVAVTGVAPASTVSLSQPRGGVPEQTIDPAPVSNVASDVNTVVAGGRAAGAGGPGFDHDHDDDHATTTTTVAVQPPPPPQTSRPSSLPAAGSDLGAAKIGLWFVLIGLACVVVTVRRPPRSAGPRQR